jgi:hypothetical protein
MARDESTLDANGISSERETSRSDAAMRSLAGAVRDQAILRICFFQKIIKGKALERQQFFLREGVFSRLSGRHGL